MVQTLCFEKIWGIDGERSEYLIGVPGDVAIVDRHVLILDRQLHKVWVFDETGRYVTHFGQTGEGPGDFRSPNKLISLPGGRVGVLDRSPGRVHQFDLAGTLLASHQVEGDAFRAVGYSIRGSDSLIVVLRGEVNPLRQDGTRGTTSWSSLVRYSPAGGWSTVYFEKFRKLAYYGNTKPAIEDEQYVLSGYDVHDSTLYVASEREHYLVAVMNADGETIRSITRKYQSRRRSRAERDSIRALRSVVVGGCIAVDYREAEFDQDIVDLRAADDGKLWVLSSRGAYDPPRGVYQEWDVFGKDGTYEGPLQIRMDADDSHDKVFWLSDDTVVLCKYWQDAEDAFHNLGPNDQIEEPVSIAQDIDLQILFMRGNKKPAEQPLLSRERMPAIDSFTKASDHPAP